MQILTICGSTRKKSSNAILLDALREVTGNRAEFISFESLANLPHFNPDIDDSSLVAEVIHLRDIVDSADLVYFATPEYIHAMPAILKNSLEWLVILGSIKNQ